ncbi:tropinone reductase homolog At2g29260, chloroplastic isoform X2 [Solanum lycopersicum]|uniref:tropinone reductase homolog At2g29260, chloroplastic isoform X2 n=1 Tax=Solanum lycopersicum TaxID=4081 RepID=UPI0008FEBA2C|nr:tropinone reductase homolog At2g29260, chloroplastic isoform X2 [Solanum lycopersicum]
MWESVLVLQVPSPSVKFKFQIPKPRNWSWMNKYSSIRCAGKVNRWSLDGMNALVTGGTRGIGHAIVEELCGLGATVHTCARNEDELEICLRSWKDEGFTVSGSLCDVSSQVDRQKLMEVVSSTFNGKLDILINNVGTNIRKAMVDFTAEEFSSVMATNFESVFHLCQLAYPLLKASGAGSVVFTSSVSGFVSLKSMSLQGATKGAINQLTKYLACEWAKDNIRSNAVAPWYIKTSMVEQVIPYFLLFSTPWLSLINYVF